MCKVIRDALLGFIFAGLFIGYKTDSLEYQGGYCLSRDNNPHLFFGTKTTYELVRGNATTNTDCPPIQMWILSRHGTRNAGRKTLKRMKRAIALQEAIIENYESDDFEIEDGLCEDDLENLKNWSWDKEVEHKAKELNDQGYEDLFELAQRYQTRFPEILNQSYVADDFYFRHTLTERTESSCRAFIDGLFGVGANFGVKIDEPVKPDSVIQSYGSCPAWKRDVRDDKLSKVENWNFRHSHPYIKLQRDVSRRLGFLDILSHGMIQSLYNNCRFDKSRNFEYISPWCAIFKKDELLLLEYEEDLDNYYYSGFGNPYASELGCHPLKNLRDVLEFTILTGQAQPKLFALFTHDIMIDMTLTALNYSRDEELSGDDYQNQLTQRLYRGSVNTPFAANIAAILHRCPGDDYKVQMYLNERPMKLEPCSDGLCDWMEFREFLEFTDRCKFDYCD